VATLKANSSSRLYKNREEFTEVLADILSGFKLTATLLKAVLMGLAERDETADYCYSGKKKEADPSLRDTDSIPLSVAVEGYAVDMDKQIKLEQQNIKDYLAREVRPHVQEFWIDHSKTKIGYEIPSAKRSATANRSAR